MECGRPLHSSLGPVLIKYSQNKHPQSQVGDGSKLKVGDISVVIKSDVEMTESSDE